MLLDDSQLADYAIDTLVLLLDGLADSGVAVTDLLQGQKVLTCVLLHLFREKQTLFCFFINVNTRQFPPQ